MSSPATTAHSPHSLGMLLVGISAIIWSAAGLFTKSVNADVWTILFWREVFSAAFMFAYLFRQNGRGSMQQFGRFGAPGWCAAILGAAATVCFISALKNTRALFDHTQSFNGVKIRPLWHKARRPCPSAIRTASLWHSRLSASASDREPSPVHLPCAA